MSACTFVLLTIPLHIRSIGHAEWLWLPSGARGDIWLKGGLYDIGLDNADPPPNN